MEASRAISHRIDEIGEGAARVARGTVAGFLGGVIASWVMTQYQAIESRPVNVRRQEEAEQAVGSMPQHATQTQAKGGDPTVKVAEVVSRKFFDHPLSKTEQAVAGPSVHYGYGGAVGALYGGLSEVLPMVKLGLGIPYAALLWLGGDEIALPMLGLTKPAHQVPAEKHASALATHFVYGITLDITRRILRRIV